MEIRFALEKDVKQLVHLCELHAAFEKSEFDSTNKFKLLSEHLLNTNSPFKCLVVEENYEIVGYATFMKQFSTWDADFYIYPDCLFLKEEARGKGTGLRIMELVKDYAKSENCKIIQWQTPDFNKRAIKFYQGLGARSKTKERFTWEIKNQQVTKGNR